MNAYIFRQALKITAPIFFGYIAIGIPFGLMIVQAGYPWWMSLLMSLTMYTGSGQYFAVGLLASGAGLSVMIVVQLLIGIRHVFYGLSLIGKYKNMGIYKPYLVFAITDETFALVSGLELPDNVNKGAMYFAISLLDQSYWVLGSVIGAVAFSVLEKYNLAQYLNGVDFALTALFVVLTIEQIKQNHDFVPAVIGILTTAVTVVLYKTGVFAASNIIWVAICFGMGVMLLLRGPSFFKNYRINKNEGENK